MKVGEIEGGGFGGGGVGKIEILDSNEVIFGDGGGRVLVHFLFFLKHFDDSN